jgi:hypothetical protein
LADYLVTVTLVARDETSGAVQTIQGSFKSLDEAAAGAQRAVQSFSQNGQGDLQRVSQSAQQASSNVSDIQRGAQQADSGSRAPLASVTQSIASISSAADALVSGISGIGQKLGAGLADQANAALKTVSIATAAATGGVAAYGQSAFMAAARVGEMNATLTALATTNNISVDAMNQSVQAVKGMGIEYASAQDLVAKFTQNQLDVTRASELARVAQDAAVLGQTNSTDALNRLVYGITTQQTEVLRTVGINVDANTAQAQYAQSIGKTTKELTAFEKEQAMMNAVLTQGQTISGAYTSAMEEPGKVLRSFPRVFDDIKVSIGSALMDGFGPLILKLYDLAKAFDTATSPGGALEPIIKAIGTAVTGLITPIANAVGRFTEFIGGLDVEKAQGFADQLARFAPLIGPIVGALAMLGGAKIGEMLPFGLGQFLAPFLGIMNPVLGALIGMLVTVPQVRQAISALFTAFTTDAGALGIINDLIRDTFGPEVQGFFQPLLQKAMDFLRIVQSFKDPLQGVRVALLAMTGINLAGMGGGAGGLLSALGLDPQTLAGLQSAFGNFTRSLGGLSSLVGPLLGFLESIGRAFLTILPPVVRLGAALATFALGGLAIVVDLLGKVGPPLLQVGSAIMDALGPIVAQMIDRLAQMFTILGPPILAVMSGLGHLLGVILPPLIQLLGGALVIAIKVLGALFTWMWDHIDSPILRAVATQLTMFGHDLDTMADSLTDAGTEAKKFWDFIQPILGILKNLGVAALNFAGEIKDAWAGLFKTGDFGAFFSSILTAFSHLADAALPLLSELVGIFKDIALKAVDALFNGLEEAFPGLSGPLEMARTLFENGLQFFFNLFTNLIDFVDAIVHGDWGRAFSDLVNIAVDFFGGLGGDLVAIIEALGPEILDELKKMGINIPDGIQQGIASGWDNFKQWVQDTFNGIIDFIRGIFKIGSPSQVFADIGTGLIEGLKGGIENLLPGLGDTIGKVKDKLGEVAGGVASRAGQAAGVVGGAVSGAVTGAAGVAGSAVSAFQQAANPMDSPTMVQALANARVVLAQATELLAHAVDMLTASMEGLTQIGGQMSEIGWNLAVGLAQGMLDWWAGINDWIDQNIVTPLLNAFKTLLGMGSPSTVMSALGVDTMQGMLDGMQNIAQGLGGWIKSNVTDVIPSFIKQFLGISSPSSVMSEIGTNIMQGLINGLQAKLPDIQKFMSSLGGMLGGGAAAAVGGDVGGWIQQAIAATGVDPSWANGLGVIIQHESGGNPSASNAWDVNAQRGDASVGLMQLTGSNRATYTPSGLDPMDPVAQIIAGINYVKSRYGDISKVPGVASVAAGGAYLPYAKGGWLTEPVVGVGPSGTKYQMHAGEYVAPAGAHAAAAAGGGVAGGINLNVQAGAVQISGTNAPADDIAACADQLWDDLYAKLSRAMGNRAVGVGANP